MSEAKATQAANSNFGYAIVALCVMFGGLGGWLVSEYEDGFQWERDGNELLTYVGIAIASFFALLAFRKARLRSLVAGFVMICGVGAVSIIGYNHRDKIIDLIRGQEKQQVVVAPGGDGKRYLTLLRNRDGHFYLTAWLDGARMRLLVDSGATSTVLNEKDARKVGISMHRLVFNVPVQTGNGTTYLARSHIKKLEIGRFIIRDIPILVARNKLSFSILGVNALRRFKGYEVAGDRMKLKW